MTKTTPVNDGHRAPAAGTPRAARCALGLILMTAATAAAPAAFAQNNGNIQPLAIEIDTSANLFQASGSCAPGGFANGPILNLGATADWVKDCLANTDVDQNPADNIAVGIVPGVTGASGGNGHWRGVRIVDGVGGSEEDIFINGGKENDTSTWTIGAGSVGSSKYDITQAYIANNQSGLFFGMERRGNNGTTAFDFEFNQVGTVGTYIPTRTIGDILFTFEMQGSGGSGSATPHVFRWNGSSYVELSSLPANLYSSINGAATPAAPWGYVSSTGNWVLGSIPRFQFAEAVVPIGSGGVALPGVNPCGGMAYVQVRTRSSASGTSDLKDTTRIFEFLFGGPEAAAVLDSNCNQEFTYAPTGSTNSGGGSTGLTYAWTFTPPGGVTLSGTGVTGPDGNGRYHSSQANGAVAASFPAGTDAATINVQLKVIESSGCEDDTEQIPITVERKLTPTASKSAANGMTLTVSLSSTTAGAESIQWQKCVSGSCTDIAGATSGTLQYSSFESDSSPSAVSFAFGGDSYVGRLYTVNLRIRARNTITHPDGSTQVCEASSSNVTVKKTIAVDP